MSFMLAAGWDVLRAEGLRYLVASGGVALGLAAAGRWSERRRIQRRRASRRDVLREIGHSAATVLIFAAVGVLLILMDRAGLVSVSADRRWEASLAQLVALILLHDAWFYWMHRALHHRLLFRTVHLLHHRSRTPTPWAAYSFAPAEAAIEASFLPLALLVLPASIAAILLFLIHQIARNAIGHSGHELMPPGFTRHKATRWLTTTTHHDLHHSDGRCNYGLYFTWWDRMMGTEHPDYHRRFEAAAKPWFAPRAACD